MTATRSRKEEIEYKKHLSLADKSRCVFCEIDNKSDQFVRETKSFKVIRNIFAYSIWDNQSVADHLMVVPKKHTDSLSNMGNSQKIEYVDLLEFYEGQEYNIYARAPSSKIKSIVHQHTHLIKPKGYKKKFLLLLRKPYVRLTR